MSNNGSILLQLSHLFITKEIRIDNNL